MVWDLVVWLSSFLVVGALLGIVVYQLMCLSDLEFDYVNPFEAASRINMLVIPEFGLQGCLSVFLLLTGHWLMFFINTPIIYYHVNLYLKKSYQVDVTEIFRDLGSERKLRLMKLAFYLILFFLIIYKLVVTAVLLILEHDSASDPGILSMDM
ncbi:unnamed protein product [Calypogeia fissa]